MPIWQAATFFFLGSVAWIHAADSGKAFAWEPLKVTQSMFTSELGMLDSEREEYATNLAAHAANDVVTTKASSQSLAEARRILALAFHLSPRNKRAVVVNFQFSKGIFPEVTQGNYSPQSLARLLLSRGQLLEKQGGDENKRAARLFVSLAAGMDPKNEDAVYASELHRLDHGPVDWNTVENPPEKTPEKTPDKVPDKTPDKTPVKVPDKAPDKVPARPPGPPDRRPLVPAHP